MSTTTFSQRLWQYNRVCSKVEDFFHSEIYLRHHCQPYPIMSSINQSKYIIRWLYSISIFFQSISVFMIVVSTLLVYERWIWMLISVMLLLATCFRALIIVFITQIDTDWCSGPCYAYLGLDAWLSVAVCVLLFVMVLCSGYLARIGKTKISLETSNWWRRTVTILIYLGDMEGNVAIQLLIINFRKRY